MTASRLTAPYDFSFMIEIDISWAIAAYLSFFITLVFMVWVFYNFYRKDSLDGEADYVRQCPYCTHIVLNYKKLDIIQCPQCGSYIKGND